MKAIPSLVLGLAAVCASGSARAMSPSDNIVIEAEDAFHSGIEYDDAYASGGMAVEFGSFGEMQFQAELQGTENALTFVYKSIGEAMEIAVSVNGGATQYATLEATNDWRPFTFDDVVVTSGVNTVTVTTDGGSCDMLQVSTVEDEKGRCIAKLKGKGKGEEGGLTPGDFMDSDHKSTPLTGGGFDVQRAYTNGNSQIVGAGFGVGVAAGICSLVPGIGWIAGGAIIILGGGGSGVAAGFAADEFIFHPAGTITNWSVTLWDNPCKIQCVMQMNFTISQTETEGATTGGGANRIDSDGTYESADSNGPFGIPKRWGMHKRSSTIKGGLPGKDSANVGVTVVAACGKTGEFYVKWAGGDKFMDGQLSCENHCD